MRTYYINSGSENTGPFTLEELKNLQINKNTLVWYEGMDDWKHAVDLVEFAPFFTVVTPSKKQSTTTPKKDTTKMEQPFFGLKKSYFFLALGFLVIMITVLVLNIIQDNKRNELDVKNKQTEFSNAQTELEQKESNEQLIQQEIQKRIASENNNKRRKDSITIRLSEIKNFLIEDKNQLAEAKNNLSDLENFQQLQSESTLEEQIRLIQNDIANWKREINQLENEANRLYLELETIH